MKLHALELFGYCVGYLGLMTPRQEDAGQSSDCPAPIHGYETSLEYGTVADPLLQIGVVALDHRPVQPGPRAPTCSGGRSALGPARIVASVG
jgi:hypothetical protein